MDPNRGSMDPLSGLDLISNSPQLSNEQKPNLDPPSYNEVVGEHPAHNPDVNSSYFQMKTELKSATFNV